MFIALFVLLGCVWGDDCPGAPVRGGDECLGSDCPDTCLNRAPGFFVYLVSQKIYRTPFWRPLLLIIIKIIRFVKRQNVKRLPRRSVPPYSLPVATDGAYFTS